MNEGAYKDIKNIETVYNYLSHSLVFIDNLRMKIQAILVKLMGKAQIPPVRIFKMSLQI